MTPNFSDMTQKDQLQFIIDNLQHLPAELVQAGLDLLVRANEIEYAVVLARDHGQIDKAIEILVDAGDYLWAGQIADKAGRREDAIAIHQAGLQYYISMKMYGRAIAAASALQLSNFAIDELYMQGIAHEGQCLDMGRAQAAMQSAIASIKIALCRNGDMQSEALSEELMSSFMDYGQAVENPVRKDSFGADETKIENNKKEIDEEHIPFCV
jgi:hypothetical protein